MTQAIKDYVVFVGRCARKTLDGDWRYYLWMTALTAVSLLGLNAYCKQLVAGLTVTGMSDQVSWGLYIANFTFLVGMAAAAVMLVVPVYVYKDETLHDVVIFGELLAVAVIVMCLLFVTVDLGRPDRFWHMIPGIGRFNWPISMLSWDVIVLNGYLALNAQISGYLVYMVYLKRKPASIWYIPFVFIAMFWAISIHTVTAFLYVGLGGRPFWNSAIVAPRFLASAFTAGPGFLILTLQVIRRLSSYKVTDKALFMLRDIVQVSMIINVFLLLCELFKEFYTDSAHVASAKYLFFGLHGHYGLVPWIWTAMVLDSAALALLVLPFSRRLRYLSLACALAIAGIWIEKGMGMVVPAFIPSPLGEIVEYSPTLNEWLICAGIWAFGMLLYTTLLKMTIPVLTGQLTPQKSAPMSIESETVWHGNFRDTA
ncbi:MAG: polysulfide reductase NrfD [Elusimicrobia bacterium]|nr:polysulfide reductase NrfD [Elusimicrobiota bacterium]